MRVITWWTHMHQLTIGLLPQFHNNFIVTITSMEARPFSSDGGGGQRKKWITIGHCGSCGFLIPEPFSLCMTLVSHLVTCILWCVVGGKVVRQNLRSILLSKPFSTVSCSIFRQHQIYFCEAIKNWITSFARYLAYYVYAWMEHLLYLDTNMWN